MAKRVVSAAASADQVRARLASIVESSEDAIVSKDLNGIITSWNRGAERIFGYTADEAIGKPVTMLMPADRSNEEPGILDRIRRGERIEHYETIRRHKSGALVDVSLSVSPLFNADGVVIGASKIARNITEAKLSRQATQRLYEIGKLCAQPSDDPIEVLGEVLDAAIWFTRANRGNIELLDRTTGTLNIVAHRGFAAAFLDFFATPGSHDASACGTALAAGDRIVVEDITTSEIFAAGPSLKVLLDAGVRAVQSTPLVNSVGTVVGMISTHCDRPRSPSERECRLLDVLARQAADYIERKHGEEQRERLLQIAESARHDAESANRAKDEFLAMLGHELRNPLSAVRNALSAALLDEASRPRALQIARRQADQLARIVDDLLDVARITHGRVALRKERVVLGDLMQRTVENTRSLMDERNHTVAVSLPSEVICLQADPARIEQAVCNLLTNAAKYTNPGGSVTVTAERDKDFAVIRVRDSGIGIPLDMLPRVFDLFAQGSRSLDRAQGGLGIGLTLVRSIVQLHGGTVEAKSRGLGAGSEFVIRLPALAPELSDAIVRQPESRRVRAAHPTRVLMVEDNPDAAESLVMILELLGHHVRVVQDGRTALAVAAANPPDIMLIDIGLPGMSGYDIARAIRQAPALKHLVLVALTGYGRAEDKEQAVMAGFDYHLVKPVDLDVLGDLVARLGAPAEDSEPVRH